MKNLLIYDPNDAVSSLRGGGRIIQILRENLPEAKFITDLTECTDSAESTLLIPSWNPFAPPRLTKRVAKKKILMIFDVIPLKYPDHFPAGIKGNFNLWRNKRNLAIFDKIITISEHSKKDIVHYLNVTAEKIEVVYPAVSKVFSVIASEARQSPSYEIATSSRHGGTPRDNISSDFRLPTSDFCLYVGDVNWNKNLVNLAKAIQIADVPCVFVGKPFLSDFRLPTSANSHPWQKEFHNFLKIAQNTKNFIFLGYVEDQHLMQLYEQAVCNVLVSRDEGFGYSYAEAATQKCPSVLSDIDIFHETTGDTALFANPADTSSIAEKITHLFQDVKARNDLGETAYQNTHTRFSPDIFRQSIIDLV